MTRGWASGAAMLTVTIATMVIVSVPSTAEATSSGEIVRAEVNESWTQASIAGTAIRPDHCEEGPEEGPEPEPGEPGYHPKPPIFPQSPPWECGWIAYATVGPGSSLEDCDSPNRRWDSIGEGVQLVWEGEELRSVGSSTFDLPAASLDFGLSAPLLCLSVIESVREDGECTEGEEPCPLYVVWHQYLQLDAALLEVPSEEEVPPLPNLLGPAPPLVLGPRPPSGPCRRAKLKHGTRRGERGARVSVSSRVKVAGKPARPKRCVRAVASR